MIPIKISLLLLLLWIPHVQADEPDSAPLKFGVLPIMSPVTLMKRFTPLSNYLSDQLPRSVIIQSARDFPTFVARVQAREFDLVYTAPHFVDLAQDDDRYELMVTPGRQLSASVVVRKDTPYQTLNDLRGKRITHAPQQAFIPIIGRALFEDAGIGEQAGTHFIAMRSHNAAYQSVAGGEADAAIISSYIATRQLNFDKWRVIQETPAHPGVAILVASDLEPELKSTIKLLLLDMREDSLGQSSLEKSLFKSFVLASREDYQPLRRYLKFAPGMQHYTEKK